MPITQVGSPKTAIATGITVSAVVDRPGTLVENDVLFAAVSSDEATVSPPTGFTAITVMTGTTNNFRGALYYKLCGPSETSTYSFGKSGGQDAPIVVTLTAWRGSVAGGESSTDFDNGKDAGAPNASDPNTSFTQAQPGRLFFFRWSRRTQGSGGTNPSYTVNNANWSLLAEASHWSGGSVRYANCQVVHNTDTGSGSRSEPSTYTDVNTTDNMYALVCLRADPAASGDLAGSTPSVTAAFDGYHRIDATLSASTPKVTAAFEALGAPPEGSLAAST